MYRGTFTDSMGCTRKSMGYFTLNQATFNKTRKVYIVQARDNFQNLIYNMNNDWRFAPIENSRGWLLRTPANGVADRIVKFLFEKGVIHEYRETSA